jgi:hypothetical protein
MTFRYERFAIRGSFLSVLGFYQLFKVSDLTLKETGFAIHFLTI